MGDAEDKKVKKVTLKNEAETLGVTYEELKKSKKSKKREAEKLDTNEHQNAQIQAIQRGVECIIATLK